MLDRMSQNSNWRQFDFSLENEVSSISLSPKKSLPVLQSPLYNWENIVMNEWNEASTKYWIVKRAEYFSDQMQNISRCCWKQKVQLPHHSNCSLLVSSWFASITTEVCVISPHKSLLEKPIMAQKQKNRQNFQKIANGNITWPALRRWLTFIWEDESKSSWDWRSRGEFIWREGFTQGQYRNVQTQKILSQNLH